jgi:ribosomal protein L32
MSVRMKLTHSKTGSRRSHHRAKTATLVRSENGVHRRHFIDPVTGMYRGKQILSPLEEKKKMSVSQKHKKDTNEEKKSGIKRIKEDKTLAQTKVVEKKTQKKVQNKV